VLRQIVFQYATKLNLANIQIWLDFRGRIWTWN